MCEDRKRAWLRSFWAMSQVWTFLTPTVDRIRIWDAALSDMSPEQIEYGVAWVLANRSGPGQPTPGEIRDAALGVLTKVPVHAHAGNLLRYEWKRVPKGGTAPMEVLDIYQGGTAGDPQCNLPLSISGG